MIAAIDAPRPRPHRGESFVVAFPSVGPLPSVFLPRSRPLPGTPGHPSPRPAIPGISIAREKVPGLYPASRPLVGAPGRDHRTIGPCAGHSSWPPCCSWPASRPRPRRPRRPPRPRGRCCASIRRSPRASTGRATCSRPTWPGAARRTRPRSGPGPRVVPLRRGARDDRARQGGGLCARARLRQARRRSLPRTTRRPISGTRSPSARGRRPRACSARPLAPRDLRKEVEIALRLRHLQHRGAHHGGQHRPRAARGARRQRQGSGAALQDRASRLDPKPTRVRIELAQLYIPMDLLRRGAAAAPVVLAERAPTDRPRGRSRKCARSPDARIDPRQEVTPAPERPRPGEEPQCA